MFLFKSSESFNILSHSPFLTCNQTEHIKHIEDNKYIHKAAENYKKSDMESIHLLNFCNMSRNTLSHFSC